MPSLSITLLININKNNVNNDLNIKKINYPIPPIPAVGNKSRVYLDL
jgi:hypothetical protein